MASDNAKKSKSVKPKSADGDAEHAGGEYGAHVEHASHGADKPAADAALGRLRTLAYAAVALSVLGVVLASTAPIWSPKIYGNATSARFLALGVAQLRPVLESDGPFSVELATLRKMASGDNEVTRALEAIASDSSTGVPTLAQLQARFPHVASEVLLSDVVDANRGWFDRMMLNVASNLELHVHVQKIKESHLPSKDVIQQANTAILAGDLTRAADVLGSLSGRPAEIAAPWIRGARARIAANRVLKLLDTVAANRLAGGYVQAATTY